MKHVAVMVIATPLALGSAAPPDGRGPVASALIRVGVVSADGKAVRGLTNGDFSVRVDGVQVDIRSVRQEDPLPVLVLVDVTVSAAGSADELRSPLSGHVFGVLARGTPVRVAAFGRTLHAPGTWTTDRRGQDALLREALSVRNDERYGPSPVWDALDESLRTLLPADGRAGILLVTDGQTSGNRVRLSVPADRAIAMGVPITVVFVGSVGQLAQRGEMAAMVRPDRALTQLAAATGGALFNRSTLQRKEWDGGGRDDPLRRGALSLSEAYRLELDVPAKSGFQRVSVTTRDTAHVVRAPMGMVVR